MNPENENSRPSDSPETAAQHNEEHITSPIELKRSGGWVKMQRSEEAFALLKHHPKAFNLLTLATLRARWKDCAITGLRIGQSYLGDFREAGLKSEGEYRHAKKVLIDCGIATFRGTNKGTVATIVDSRIFDVSADSNNGQNDRPATDQQQASNEPTTTNEEGKKETRVGHSEAASWKKSVPDIIAIYPKREKDHDATLELARQIERGEVDMETVAAGTRAIAAIIPRLTGGHLNRYVPSALAFFRDRRWQDDPQTWLRNAPTTRTGAPAPNELDLGGRRGTTVKIKSTTTTK